MSTYLNASPIFGPVHSRRLGLSLGVNLMPASGKICTFDCIYCENGFDGDRRTSDGYVTLEEVTSALEAKLQEMAAQGTAPDVITLAGNGEPTASPIFPEAVDATLRLRDAYAPQAQVTVLSNGTCADRPAVHAALMRLDNNIQKLDTVDPDYIAALDQPVGPYDVSHQVRTFASFQGHVIIQTIFLAGTYRGRDMDNTSDAYVQPWLDALAQIRPSAVTVYTIARDTPALGLRKAAPEVLDGIADRVRALGIDCTVSY